jgi:hypothetical protein
VPLLEWEVDSLRVKLAKLVNHSPAKDALKRIDVDVKHIEKLGNPEKPDPSWHLVQSLLELGCNFLVLTSLRFFTFLDNIEDLWDHKPALVESKSRIVQVAFQNTLKHDICSPSFVPFVG